MKSLKDKMYNYEVAPPYESWQQISLALDEEGNSKKELLKKRNTAFYFSAAAAVVIIVLSLFFLVNSSNKKITDTVESTKLSNDINKNSNLSARDDKITIPKTNEDEDNVALQTNGNKDYNKIKKEGTGENVKKYITISGPEGQPIKISSKVASLIVSSDEQNPPNAVWSAKVNKWREVMKAKILSPSTANFLDIVELTHAININNP